MLTLLLWQRWELAELAQWREDQATNLWIGSQVWAGRYLPSIGLISSTGLPNPNGMAWLGVALSVLPSLQAISFCLGLLQLVLISRLCRAYGPVLARWYPEEPYTIGRAYDWELRRRWGLQNQDKGIAQGARTWHGQRYTISMVGAPVPECLPPSARHVEFGRVRVSVVHSR